MPTQQNLENNLSEASDSDNLLADTDVAIIGGGVVGCAVARRLALEGASVILVEKAADILEGASKGNSAILHTGFDAPVGTLEWECVRSGYREYLEIHQSLGLPLLETGALIAAWTEEEENRFEGILKKGLENGIDDLCLLTKKETLKLEPNLAPTVRSAISVPREFVIDPWSAPLAYLTQALENGGQLLCNAGVTGGEFDGEKWQLQTERGRIRARFIINSAGLHGDILNQDVLGSCDFHIKPRKGQFVVFDKSSKNLVRSIILPVPTKRTKGIVLFPTIFGNMMVGPTAEEQESRDDASVDETILGELHTQAVEHLPGLKDIPVTAIFAGIRPATERPEYRITEDRDKNWITLGGIRSTGLTSALGIAAHVHNLLRKQGVEFTALVNPHIPKLPNLAEHLPRDYQTEGYGEIVCHCEMVTRREITAALESKAPAGNLGGLKRRTRATMGRCQGFYCSARLAELTKGKFAEPIGAGETDE